MVFVADASVKSPPGERQPYLGGFAIAYVNAQYGNGIDNEAGHPALLNASSHPMLSVQAWKVDWLPSSLHSEMLAIAECLRVAFVEARAGRFDGKVKVFNDSRVALEILSQVDLVQMIRVSGLFDEILLAITESIIWLTDQLSAVLRSPFPVSLHWIPGHDHIFVVQCLVDELSRDVWMGTSQAQTAFAETGLYAYDRTTWDSTLAEDIEYSLVAGFVTDGGVYNIPSSDQVIRQCAAYHRTAEQEMRPHKVTSASPEEVEEGEIEH
ncbi:hypothetical protein V8F20_006373 [Naviculisporaceae sp. PSN 640]